MFVFLVIVHEGDGTEAMDQFLEAATSYAIANKGGLPRGLQTGIGTVPVLFSTHRSSEIESWSSSPRGRRFGALTWLVAADLETRTVAEPERMRVGGLYVPYFRQLVRDYVEPALARRPQ